MDPVRRVLRKAVVGIAGIVVVLVGVAMLVLPGPGLITIFAGLALLGREFTWAARTVHVLRRRAAVLWARLRRRPLPDLRE